MKSGARTRAYRFGLEAEFLGEVLLRLKGYSILERRFLCRGGEVDLIVRRGTTLAFVEVKARKTLAEARAAIDDRKRERIARAARIYLGRLKFQPATIRCDAVLVAPFSLPRHIEGIGELPGF